MKYSILSQFASTAMAPRIFTLPFYPKRNLDIIIKQMKKDKVTKVLLKPFMDVAGDHAQNDMAGDEPKSMKSVLIKNGFEVIRSCSGFHTD